jgi:hypothetical protein
MPISQSEKTFGSRFVLAQDLLSAVTNFTNYEPPHAEQTLVGFASLLQSVAESNREESSYKKDYCDAVFVRRRAFKEDPKSVAKILPAIRAAVLVQFGKESSHFQEIQAIIKRMRDSRVARSLKAKKELSPNEQQALFEDGESHNVQPQETLSKISRSERSYGAMVGHFQGIVHCLRQMPEYNPSNNDLKAENLQAFVDSLYGLSKDVNETLHRLNLKRRERSDLYKKLSENALLIKHYVKAQYGMASPEFDLVKKIKV